jgi:hypothetical protein
MLVGNLNQEFGGPFWSVSDDRETPRNQRSSQADFAPAGANSTPQFSALFDGFLTQQKP